MPHPKPHPCYICCQPCLQVWRAILICRNSRHVSIVLPNELHNICCHESSEDWQYSNTKWKHFVVKQRKETVTDLKKSCTTTQSIQPLHSQSEETSGTFPLMERTLPSALTDTILCLTTISATLLALSSVNEAILARAKNSNGTTVRTFSNFNLLRDHCTLLPFPSALTSFMLSWQY